MFVSIILRSMNLNSKILTRSKHLTKNQAYINGNWVNATNNKTFEVKNPADGSLVGVAPDMTPKDTQMAIDAAYDAFYLWSELTPKQRTVIMRRWHDSMVAYGEEVARIMTAESGKPIVDARGEVAYGNSYIDWFADEARRIHGEIVASPVKSKQIMIYKQPIGVAGLITPWNFPHAMLVRKASAALAAGCTVVARPAEDTPLTALAIAELADKAGIPKGVFNLVPSSRENAGPIGKLFCESPRVAGISFTGSTQVGKILYGQCANGIKRIALELGGNAPFIVFKSADVDKAVQGALSSKFRNCGQTCISANRFLIHESIFDEFIQKFKQGIKKIVLGNGKHENVTAGPLINKAQVTKVSNFVNDAVQKGAKVITGGKIASEHGELFFQPTLLTNIKYDMLLYTEEIFGPVAACMSFKTEEEAVRISNNSLRGLAGYFYSSDVSQIFRVARHLEVGMVGVNEGMISMAEAAFGGIKQSGIGREGSNYGIDDYVYVKYMCLGNMS